MSPFLKPHTTQNSGAQFSRGARLSKKTLAYRIGALSGAFLMMVLYVVQVNAVSVKGFTMQDMQGRIQSLQRENQRLQLTIAQLQSSDEMKSRIASLGLVNDGPIEYIKTSGNAVAMGK